MSSSNTSITSTPSFDTRYDKLNKAQKEAVDSIDGPLLVVAGPGSGKTEILSLRVAKILKEAQVLPSNILCLTFTESASINMRDRLAKLIGQEAYRVSIHTFHNFCTDIIQKYPEFFYKGAIFSPADPISQISVLEEIFESLPFDNPLRTMHSEQGFLYLSDTAKTISNLKKSGVMPDEIDSILAQNEKDIKIVEKILIPILDKRISKSTVSELKSAIEELRKEEKRSILNVASKSNVKVPSNFFIPLIEAVCISLEIEIEKAESTEKNDPISKWKTKWFKKDDSDNRIFADALNMEKIKAVANIYRIYREEMHKRSLFDFDDMILDVISAIEKHPRLRYDLQEQYQYILVDEFQDTNNAQMRILRLLADAPVNEGRPNIMAVGDDDQAIYKFQGAVLSNILNFSKMYNDVKVVTMIDNYRSTQDILDIATHIIRKGEDRLEDIIENMDKTLVASNKDLLVDADIAHDIVHKEFETSLHEYYFVSREIKKLIERGVPAKNIAVIARKHKQLESLVPSMQSAKVPIRYEREQNVFQEPHIEQLIIMSRFIATLVDKDKEEADEYLPKILSFPFWNISRKAVWQLSITAHNERKTWLQCMLDSDDVNMQNIAELLIDLGVRAASEPLEKILDEMIGAHVQLAQESEEDEDMDRDEYGADNRDIGDNSFTNNKGTSDANVANIVGSPDAKISSPFKSYYFNKERFEHSRTEYLTFLSSLRVFVKALREYKGKAGTHDTLVIKDLVEFVDIHIKNEVPLNDESPFATARDAVNLLSVHKSKGLEFDVVFVLSCQDNVWAGRGFPKKISMPINMPIDPVGDNESDQLRLFYVAITRAKKNLYLTSHKVRDDGKESDRLRFITAPENPEEVMKNESLRKLYTPETISVADGALDSLNTGANGMGDEMAEEKSLKSEKSQDTEKSHLAPETHELLTASWLLYHTTPFLDEEEELLRSLLEGYQLSVTHLNNFLNIEKGGPQLFLEQNLLRFPQSKTPSSSYGSAIHRTLERLSVKLRFEGILASEEEFIGWFLEYLRIEKMSKVDFNLYKERGVFALSAFYKKKKDTFSATDKTEVNFKEQGVVIGSTPAHLTGKIDRMIDLGGGRFEVHDYKTGKVYIEWEQSQDYKKTKIHEYERQLIFYKILVEEARDYGKKNSSRVDVGVLEFVEPLNNDSNRIIDLSMHIDKEKFERVKRLVDIVYNKIMNLDFPDTSAFSKDFKGNIEFEEWLLAGN